MSDKEQLAPVSNLSIEEILELEHFNDGLFRLVITRPASFRFRSGEFVMLGLPVGGKPLLRAYSMVCPSYSDTLEFLSINLAEGPLTSKLSRKAVGEPVYLGKKPTGTLVLDALLPGKRLFLLSTGTGIAPFMSIARDPETYAAFEHVVIVHSVRRVDDLAYRGLLESRLAEDPLVAEEAATRLHYIPTVTREQFHTQGRISQLIESGRLFESVPGPDHLDPETDRVMLCGSMAMIKDHAADLEARGFTEGSNAAPGQFVIERAFVG